MITLGADQLAAIEGAAAAAFPSECCGLLVGCVGTGGAVEVSRIVPSPNLAKAPARRFDIGAGRHESWRAGFGFLKRLRECQDRG